MARFRFRLQKVLEARRAFEDNAKRELGSAQRELTRQRRIRDNLITERRDFLVEMSERRKHRLPAQLYVEDIQYEWQLRLRIREQRNEVKKAERTVEQKREALVKAMKERKMMEKLRERHWERFKEKVKAEEFAFADEISGRNAQFPNALSSGE